MPTTVVNDDQREIIGGNPDAPATEGKYPNWVNDPASADWNTVYLGDSIIPGICSIEDLEVGIDIDTKKAKGADKPTSTDNGLKPSKFRIQVWLNGRDWPEFQAVAGSFQPRRPGRERSPLRIIHPLVNFLGIQIVRVSGIKMDHPTSKGGMKIGILCEEWFDKPVEAKKAKPKKADPRLRLYTWEERQAALAAKRDSIRDDFINDSADKDPNGPLQIDPRSKEILGLYDPIDEGNLINNIYQ